MLLVQSEDLLKMVTELHQEELVSISYQCVQLNIGIQLIMALYCARTQACTFIHPVCNIPEFVAPKHTDRVYADAAQGLCHVRKIT